jgi:hypothetical protein
MNDKYLEQCAMQRAAIMALLTKFMREQNDELTIRNVKIAICNFFSQLIDNETMVADEIEVCTLESIQTFLQKEAIVEAFQES